MVLVWRIADDSPNSPNFLPTKHSHYTVFNLYYMATFTIILFISVVGLAYRNCLENAEWDMTINVSQCHTVEILMLSDRANELQSILSDNTNNGTRDLTTTFDIMEVQVVSDELAMLTNNTGSALLPNDLDTTNNIVNTLIR